MKQQILLVACLSLLFFSAGAQGNAADPIFTWQIDTETAGRMIIDQKNCSDCKFIKWMDKSAVKDLKKELRKSLGIASINLRRHWFTGRYRAEDEARYAKNHNLDPGSPAAKVEGYTNKILRYKIPQKDRRKYTTNLQGYHRRPHVLGTPYRMSLLYPYLLQLFKKPPADFSEQKFMYFDVGRLCPPPNGC